MSQSFTPFASTYDHKDYEDKWRKFWEEGQFFHPSVDASKTPYTILIPPPNVTARLHMGHGLNNTLQDILCRWKRMQGFNVCWLPGTDHAGIATQMMVEKSLEEKGLSRNALGREEFFKKCVEWKDENGGMIVNQQKMLGCSCDWQREAYTMSPALSRAVRKIFVDLYEKGLIYRGERLVNWDTVLKTAVSDDEVLTEEEPGFLYQISYQLEHAQEDLASLIVATTRPETLFGDTAVAVHPEDERYCHLIGKKIRIPFIDRLVPIIADEHVKKDFGTGCLKVTPAHDFNDFEIGQRHKLEAINILNEDGTLNEVCPKELQGLSIKEARKQTLRLLKEKGLLIETKPIKHAVPISDRSKSVIEPRLSKQWYVKMQALAQPAIEAAQKDEICFYPPSFKKVYFHWLENIKDWCISRQLWWGHRMPIWYCDDCGHTMTGMEDPSSCSSCSGRHLTQDADVLDTWFSSWLWPLSPFGWPEETRELNYFFPSNVLITAPEIIFLWVARMIMVSFFTKGRAPFKDVYFNATICDKQGRKFSKTLGNGIDPLEMIDRYGADAVRYTCLSLAPLGGRVKMDPSDFEHGNRFVNKIWNAARFLFNKLHEQNLLENMKDFSLEDLSIQSRWLISSFHEATYKIEKHLETYQLNMALEQLYHFIWSSFCDWGLESAKIELEQALLEEKRSLASALSYVFEGLLRLAAPFMPFVTEELWSKLPSHPRWKREKSLCTSSYPKADLIPEDLKAFETWNIAKDIIGGIRSLRTQAKILNKEKLSLGIVFLSEETKKMTLCCLKNIELFGGIFETSLLKENQRPEKSLMISGKGYILYLCVGDHLDFALEKKRLHAEKERIEKIVFGLSKKLESKDFCARAPEEVVQQTKDQLENMSQQLEAIKENLNSF